MEKKGLGKFFMTLSPNEPLEQNQWQRNSVFIAILHLKGACLQLRAKVYTFMEVNVCKIYF